jgi:phytanoyl-CoA hydroxylase
VTVFSIRDLPDAIEAYRRDGFVSFDDVIDHETLRALRSAFDESVADGRIAVDPSGVANNNDAVLLHDAFMELLQHQGIVAIAESLVGKFAELQHSKFFNKPGASTGEVKWHQDFPFFPHTNFDLHAIGIHFDDEAEGSGSVEVIEGSHHWGPLSHVSDDDFMYACTDERFNMNGHKPVSLQGPAGFVTVHDSRLMHASPPKSIAGNRRVLYLQVRAADCVQLAGVVWRCAGIPFGERNTGARFARLEGGIFELRGQLGKLVDLFGQLAPTHSSGGSISE